MGKISYRYSLRTIALLFPPQSLQRVYLHGLWQQSRGRYPTLLHGNQHDPREAFAAAKELEGEYIDSIRRLHNSRNPYAWTPELVKAIQEHRPLTEIAEHFWTKVV